MPRDPSTPRNGLQRALDRLAAVIAIGLIAVSGGLLAELNQQARAEAVPAAFASTATG